jgi:hypothetical protein
MTTDWTTGVRPPEKTKVFSVASVSRPDLRPTQPPIQKARSVTLITYPHLVPMSRMSRSYNPLPIGVCMA